MFTVDEILAQHLPTLCNRPVLHSTTRFVLRRLLHEREFQQFQQDYPHLSGIDFVEQVLTYFDVSYSVRDTEKDRIPRHGRIVIIANHPIGSLDGLALIKLVSEVRRDIKVVANSLLTAVPPLQTLVLPVNNMGTCVTPREKLRHIVQHLEADGAVIIFPAGEVSRLRPQGIRDTHWRGGFLRMALSTRSSILPIYVDGRNSSLFYGASMLCKPLSTLLLVGEMFRHRSQDLPLRIGEMIPWQSYHSPGIERRQQIRLFRRHLYRIGQGRKGVFTTQSAIAPPEDRCALRHAIDGCQQFGSTADGKRIVLYAHSDSSAIMRELGRLREIAFRAVGEGSQRRRDTDVFDSHYFHLLLWDPQELEIVGAYRLGDAARLRSAGGPGLYTGQLFRYGPGMQPYFEQGLELGRAFVQPRYWGKRSLDSLWQGIGAFLQHHPQYRYLFGPVSISGAMPMAARDLLIDFYQKHFGGPTTLAAALHPYQPGSDTNGVFAGEHYAHEFKHLKQLLASMGVAVPTLLKQYTELCQPGGAKVLSFSVDPAFSQCIDALILIDCEHFTPRKAQRYLNRKGATVNCHGKDICDQQTDT